MKPKKQKWMEKTNILLINILLIIALTSFVSADPSIAITETNPTGYVSEEVILIEVVTNIASNCKYDFNETNYSLMNYTMNGTGTLHEYNHELEEGEYELKTKCYDGADETDLEIIEFVVDRTEPNIIVDGPTGTINEEEVTLDITTNEDAYCKFDIIDETYDQMSWTFTHTGGTIHHHDLSLAQGEYEYFVKCRDNAENENSETIDFTINLKPTATVSIEGDDLVGAGRYDVTLKTSEELDEVPTLQYNFNDDGNKKTVSLTGSGESYRGYIIIPDNDKERIGTFFFLGVDESGTEGTEITSGKLFLVDTKKPAKPASLTVEAGEGEIEVKWFYDGEQTKHFKIYRDTNTVDKTDFYTTIKGTTYTDLDVDPGTSYYYRISAVDEAGNEGDYSEQAGTEPLVDEFEIKENDIKINSNLKSTINNKIDEYERTRLDIESTLSYLNSASDPHEIKVIEILNLVEQTKLAQKNQESFITQLNALYEQDISSEELNKRIDKIDQISERTTKTVIKEIKIESRADFEQFLEEIDYNTALNELFLDKDVTESERKDYLQRVKELQDFITVTGSTIYANIVYFDESEKKYSIIEKSINSRNALSDVEVIEIIPKTVARRASDIEFTEVPTILNEDPVVKWNLKGLDSHKISYYVEGEKDLNSMKLAKTIVVQPYEKTSVEEETPEVTGLVSLDEPDSQDEGINIYLVGVGIVIIVGLLVYYFFFMNLEESYENREQKSNFGGYFKANTAKLVTKHLPKTEMTPEEQKFRRLLSLADNLANNLHLKQAQQYYYKLYNEYTLMSHKTQNGVHGELDNLYNKLQLIMFVEETKKLIQNGDFYSVSNNVVQIRQNHAILAKNTKLYGFVKSNHDAFMNWLENDLGE